MNEVTLFRLFGSKEALIVEALDSHARALSLPRLPAHARNPLLELTTWAIQFHRSMRRSQALARRVIGESDQQPEMGAWAEATIGRAQRDLDRYLRRLGRNRAVKARDVEAAGEMLVAALAATALSLPIVPRHPRDSEETAEVQVSLFLRAIGLG